MPRVQTAATTLSPHSDQENVRVLRSQPIVVRPVSLEIEIGFCPLLQRTMLEDP